MSREKTRTIESYYHEALSAAPEIRALANAATADLFYGDTSSEGYPGFESACAAIRAWAQANVSTLYYEPDADYVGACEPQGESDQCYHCLDRKALYGAADLDTCEVCEGTGKVWVDPMPYEELSPCDIVGILFGDELKEYVS